MAKEFPKELVRAFRKCQKSEWSDQAYAKFAEEAKKYLKGKADDKIEHGRLVVDLARLTYREKDERPNKKRRNTDSVSDVVSAGQTSTDNPGSDPGLLGNDETVQLVAENRIKVS